MPYFSERQFGPKPRTAEALSEGARIGLLNYLRAQFANGSLGMEFPEYCSDFPTAIVGTNIDHAEAGLRGYDLYPLLTRHPEPSPPTDAQVFDLIEFVFEKIGKPYSSRFHDYYAHYHLTFNQGEGRAEFRTEVNKIFALNGLAFDLNENGQVVRLAPEVLREAITKSIFETGDVALNELLNVACAKYLNRSLEVRKEALEKLWDAWERLKTIEAGRDKKESTGLLIGKAATDEAFREVFDKDGRDLTSIGNNFMIRHTEVGKTEITKSIEVDYLFHRLFALIRLLLEASGRIRHAE